MTRGVGRRLRIVGTIAAAAMELRQPITGHTEAARNMTLFAIAIGQLTTINAWYIWPLLVPTTTKLRQTLGSAFGAYPSDVRRIII